MNKTPKKQSISGPFKDFAHVETEAGNVLLEANEWDLSLGWHRAVTLSLHPMEARLLAGMLSRNADEAELEIVKLN